MKKYRYVIPLLFILAACTPNTLSDTLNSSDMAAVTDSPQEASVPMEVKPSPTLIPSPTATSKPVQDNEPAPAAPTPTKSKPPEPENLAPTNPVQASGPEEFPPEINPLTGLPVSNPALLELPPALVSVTNFPVSARPQAGLSFASYIFELYIGEGMTRFLALFYGQYPSLDPQGAVDTTVVADNQPEIGPVRSGRLPYQAIRKLYNGFLVMASASPEVEEVTTEFTNIFGSDSDDINSALIDVTRLRSIAEDEKNKLSINLTGNAFDEIHPEGGQNGPSLWVFYNSLNQVQWTYDSATGDYLRFQDNADGSGEFYPVIDRLTGEQLSFENVIVLFAKHDVLNSDRTLIDVDLLYSEGEAYLFRDGQVYPLYWTTLSGEYEKSTGRLRPIRFMDRSGNPMPLKPGSTWVELVNVTTDFTEIEPGVWKARFYAP
jgi:hypothetical protein